MKFLQEPENIPIEPDLDNAGAGNRSCLVFPLDLISLSTKGRPEIDPL